MVKYTPRQGDFVSYFFDNQTGHEQNGRRPALIVSNILFNENTNVLFVCPVTSNNRKYPFHISIPSGGRVEGVVMVDQMKAVDVDVREVRFLEKAPLGLVQETLAMLRNILQ